jgi:hypothetical protein
MAVSSLAVLKVLFEVTKVEISIEKDHATLAFSLTIQEVSLVDGAAHDHSSNTMWLALIV